MPLTRFAVRAVVLGLVAAGCVMGCANAVRSKDVLALFNTGKPAKPRFAPVAREVTDMTRQTLADAYFSSSCVTSLLEADDTPAHIASALACASAADDPKEEDECFHHLFQDLKLPLTPPEERRDAKAWALEQDVTRLEVNLKRLVRSVVAYHKTSQLKGVSRTDSHILGGLSTGLSNWREYQAARHVARERAHAITTMVMSGGSANGAFTAGAVWWLLGRLDACKATAERAVERACPTRDATCVAAQRALPQNACLEDHLDMIAGTSTGALITAVLKNYFSTRPNARREALDLLTRSYTCTVNADLYCVTDTGLGDLGVDSGGKAMGLVRFNGAAKLLDTYIDELTLRSIPEYFVSTVEYQTGRTNHLSSVDRHDIPNVRALKQAILSSIVEPMLSEPVVQVGNMRGVFIDGGVRSGLPVSTPLARGAERAIVFVNNPLEPRPLNAAPANAIEMGMRTLDLLVHQPIVSELHQAEYELATRRTIEYERCVERLLSPPAPPDAPVPPRCTYADLVNTTLKPLPADPVEKKITLSLSGPHSIDEEIEKLCSGDLWPSDGAGQVSIAVEQPPTELPRSVSRAYRSAWVFEPHELPDALSGSGSVEPGIDWEQLAAAGYSFDPKQMWQLFVFGAGVGQQRCKELQKTLGWHLEGWCGGAEELRQALSPIRKRAELQCWDRDLSLKVCSKSDSAEFKD